MKFGPIRTLKTTLDFDFEKDFQKIMTSSFANQKTSTTIYFLNGPNPASLSFIFGLFKQTSLQFIQQIYMKKCPSSIHCWESNPQPSEKESLSITTRPGLTPYNLLNFKCKK